MPEPSGLQRLRRAAGLEQSGISQPAFVQACGAPTVGLANPFGDAGEAVVHPTAVGAASQANPMTSCRISVAAAEATMPLRVTTAVRSEPLMGPLPAAERKPLPAVTVGWPPTPSWPELRQTRIVFPT
jgi:hypothetical protein